MIGEKHRIHHGGPSREHAGGARARAPRAVRNVIACVEPCGGTTEAVGISNNPHGAQRRSRRARRAVPPYVQCGVTPSPHARDAASRSLPESARSGA